MKTKVRETDTYNQFSKQPTRVTGQHPAGDPCPSGSCSGHPMVPSTEPASTYSPNPTQLSMALRLQRAGVRGRVRPLGPWVLCIKTASGPSCHGVGWGAETSHCSVCLLQRRGRWQLPTPYASPCRHPSPPLAMNTAPHTHRPSAVDGSSPTADYEMPMGRNQPCLTPLHASAWHVALTHLGLSCQYFILGCDGTLPMKFSTKRQASPAGHSCKPGQERRGWMVVCPRGSLLHVTIPCWPVCAPGLQT